MTKTKRSFGIICCRRSSNAIQMLMIKKATTYQFSEFVLGNYTRDNETHMRRLFNNMTHHEKILILSMNFEAMWYHMYMENPNQLYYDRCNILKVYLQKKTRFETTFLQHRGKLERIIRGTNNAETPWEFPRGRKSGDNENDIDAAVREFWEETGIDSSKYRIMWHLRPYVESYIDFNVRYHNIYYYAEAIGSWDPIYRFDDRRQTCEVAAVRWLSKTDLSHMQLDQRTLQRMKLMFDKIIAKYKNAGKKIIGRLGEYIDQLQQIHANHLVPYQQHA